MIIFLFSVPLNGPFFIPEIGKYLDKDVSRSALKSYESLEFSGRKKVITGNICQPWPQVSEKPFKHIKTAHHQAAKRYELSGPTPFLFLKYTSDIAAATA